MSLRCTERWREERKASSCRLQVDPLLCSCFFTSSSSDHRLSLLLSSEGIVKNGEVENGFTATAWTTLIVLLYRYQIYIIKSFNLTTVILHRSICK